MKYGLFLLLLLVSGSFLYAQDSIKELQKELERSSSQERKMVINYQLAQKYIRKDAKTAGKYARRAHDLAVNRNNYNMAAQAAFLLSQSYLNSRDKKNGEVWLKSCFKLAKLANDPDLIIKSVYERSKLAERSRNYRRAYEINKEAFNYFSEKGMSVSEQLNKFEVEKSKLASEKKKLEKEKDALDREIRSLTRERSQLLSDKDNLEERQKVLEEEKEKVEQEITLKEEALENISEEKEAAEELAQRSKQQVAELSREKLEQEVLLKEKEVALWKAKDTANRNRLLWILSLLITAFLIVLALILYGRFRAKNKANAVLSEKNKIIEDERERSDELLLNILPQSIANELKEHGKAKAQRFESVTVLFADFRNFTHISELLSPEQLVNELDHCFKAFDYIISNYKIEKIKTIGDAYMCASGLDSKRGLPTDMIKAAIEIQEFLYDYKQERSARGLPYFEARIGVHTGPVVAGVVGVKKFAYDIWGETVNIAARMEANCEPGRINVSEATYDKIRYQFDFEYRGKGEAKNVGQIDMYYVKMPALTTA
ncbi:MAG: adenylate/guanylate cyclase domain-containing protein [Bacteroidota bacterium]